MNIHTHAPSSKELLSECVGFGVLRNVLNATSCFVCCFSFGIYSAPASPVPCCCYPQDGVTIADINKLNRFREPPESGLMCDLLWADPHPMKGRAPSKRGVGLSFGPDVTDEFLKTNNLKMVRC